jgi:hypothetical protein
VPGSTLLAIPSKLQIIANQAKGSDSIPANLDRLLGGFAALWFSVPGRMP